MASASSNIWKSLKPHIPMIRFRKRLYKPKVESTVQTSSVKTNILTPIASSTLKGTGIDEEYLPKRYHRKPLTQLEIEFIDRGGPDLV